MAKNKITFISLCILSISFVMGAKDSDKNQNQDRIMFYMNPEYRITTNIIMSAIMMAFGVLLMTLGFRIKRVGSITSAFFWGTIIVLLVFYSIKPPKIGDNTKAIVYMSLSCIAGLATAATSQINTYTEMVFVGLLSGKLLGFYIMIWMPISSLSHFWVRLLLLTIPAIGLGILATILPKILYALLTSFSGAFMLLAGLDFYLKTGFTHNFIALFVKNPELMKKSAKLYFFLTAVVALFAVSSILNIVFRKKQKIAFEYYEKSSTGTSRSSF
ncbi:hypothetical protein BB561_006142 [Smittium simulii]|uniref:Transmembrane protein 198 n=1 Tax=Smittium simulii TaxID=133385 RepID=A0A2T9Y6B4_9FUNG|nr:hypothetical protein BB561_006142 [Smittium simulii]